MIKAGGTTMHYEIQKLTISVWNNKEELVEE
jgi:hypothetical protein